jgi:basic membrane protein A
MKKLLAVLLVVALIFSIVGCSGQQADIEPEGEGDVEAPAEVEMTKVALLMAGPINDQGWNSMAYNGLVRIGEDYENVETSFAESITKSDNEEVARGYAMQGFDLIIAHGFEFNDTVIKVAPEYPDVQFVVVNGSVEGIDNVSTVSVNNKQQGFIAGTIAATITETDSVAGIGGLVIPPIVDMVNGFIAGAKYANPDVAMNSSMVGSFDDVTKAKGLSLALLGNGADTIISCCDLANMGVLEAAKENGAYYVGTNTDISPSGMDNVVNTVLTDGGRMFTFVYEQFLSGELGADAYTVGVAEEAIFLADWNDQALVVDEADRASIEEIIMGTIDGSIDYVGLTADSAEY